MSKEDIDKHAEHGRDSHDHDLTYENEHSTDLSPMVRISINEYNTLRDQAKEAGKYITDPSLISIIDKIEELTRALRKHIVRKY
jgi:hypothetical protein|tara:strand:- start:627 stop:878 length:252 start_codon:yes stop_codon:yes gene_type:complete